MLIHVTADDFRHADEALPPEAFRWMRQEFAVNFALQRAFPDARVIKVDHDGIRIDGTGYRKPVGLYWFRAPYSFPLTRGRWVGRFYVVGTVVRRLWRLVGPR